LRLIEARTKYFESGAGMRDTRSDLNASRAAGERNRVNASALGIDPDDPQAQMKWEQRMNTLRQQGEVIPAGYHDFSVASHMASVDEMSPKDIINHRPKVQPHGPDIQAALAGKGMDEDGNIYELPLSDQERGRLIPTSFGGLAAGSTSRPAITTGDSHLPAQRAGGRQPQTPEERAAQVQADRDYRFKSGRTGSSFPGVDADGFDQGGYGPGKYDKKSASTIDAHPDRIRLLKDLERQRLGNDLYGKPGPPGSRYDENLKPYNALDKSKIPQSMVRMHIDNLDKASLILGGGLKPDGTTKGDGPARLAQWYSHATSGRAPFADESYNEAFDTVGHAVSALTAAVEGQRHANAMDVRFLGYFMPSPWDKDDTKKFKLEQARQFFASSLKDKNGAPADLPRVFRSNLELAVEKIKSRAEKNGDELRQGAQFGRAKNGDMTIDGQPTRQRFESQPSRENSGASTSGGNDGWSIREIK
jgi:hypothetical protein